MQRTKKLQSGEFSNILACDPSLRAFGWAVLSGGNVLATGCIKTSPNGNKAKNIRKSDDRCLRVSYINTTLISVIKEYSVLYIVSELPNGTQNAAAATALGLVVGALQSISDCLEIGIEWYSEGDSKMALLNKRSATKPETITAIKKIFRWIPSGVGYKDEAVADALSIYHASKASPIIKFLQNDRKDTHRKLPVS